MISKTPQPLVCCGRRGEGTRQTAAGASPHLWIRPHCRATAWLPSWPHATALWAGLSIITNWSRSCRRVPSDETSSATTARTGSPRFQLSSPAALRSACHNRCRPTRNHDRERGRSSSAGQLSLDAVARDALRSVLGLHASRRSQRLWIALLFRIVAGQHARHGDGIGTVLREHRAEAHPISCPFSLKLIAPPPCTGYGGA